MVQADDRKWKFLTIMTIPQDSKNSQKPRTDVGDYWTEKQSKRNIHVLVEPLISAAAKGKV